MLRRRKLKKYIISDEDDIKNRFTQSEGGDDYKAHIFYIGSSDDKEKYIGKVIKEPIKASIVSKPSTEYPLKAIIEVE